MRANTPQPQETDVLLASLDARIRAVAVETFRELSRAGDAGCVKVKTAARLLDMNESSVRQLIRDGELKVIRPKPNRILIPKSEIQRFVEQKS